MEKEWKIIDVIDWGKVYFASKDIESPRLNIEQILCKVLRIDRLKLYMSYDLPMSKNELADSKELILRRAKGEPLQYLIGNTSFMGFEIELTNDVLITRPETEELVDLVFKDNDKFSTLKILDIGTGSGCISIALASHFQNSTVTAIDKSEAALKIAKSNSIVNKVDDRIIFKQIDILSEVIIDEYDIILSNPPYISSEEFRNIDQKEISFEPEIALTDYSDGLTFYRKFNDLFKSILKPNGKFYLEFAFNQHLKIDSIFNTTFDLTYFNDFNNIIRFVKGKVKI